MRYMHVVLEQFFKCYEVFHCPNRPQFIIFVLLLGVLAVWELTMELKVPHSYLFMYKRALYPGVHIAVSSGICRFKLSCHLQTFFQNGFTHLYSHWQYGRFAVVEQVEGVT